MRKVDLFRKLRKIDNELLELCNGHPKADLNRLTCKDLKRAIEAWETLYELFDKCIEKENTK